MLTYTRKETSTPKICLVGRRDVSRLLWHSQVDQKSSYWTSQLQVWIPLQDDTFGSYWKVTNQTESFCWQLTSWMKPIIWVIESVSWLVGDWSVVEVAIIWKISLVLDITLHSLKRRVKFQVIILLPQSKGTFQEQSYFPMWALKLLCNFQWTRSKSSLLYSTKSILKKTLWVLQLMVSVLRLCNKFSSKLAKILIQLRKLEENHSIMYRNKSQVQLKRKINKCKILKSLCLTETQLN